MKFIWVDPKKEGFVRSYQSITGLKYPSDNLPRNSHFWQVGLLDVVLSEYPDKSLNFRNLIFMTSSLHCSFVSTAVFDAQICNIHNLFDIYNVSPV